MPKLTPTKVPIRLPSGKTSTAIRHKNLVPKPGPGTPAAGAPYGSVFGETIEVFPRWTKRDEREWDEILECAMGGRN
jgi:hypothetical protein